MTAGIVADRASSAPVLNNGSAAPVGRLTPNAPVVSRAPTDSLARVAGGAPRQAHVPAGLAAPQSRPSTLGPNVVGADSPDTNTTPSVPLTAEQRAAIAANVDAARARASNMPRIYDRNDPNARVFVLMTDGTRNDRRMFRNPGDRTNPDKIEAALRKTDDPHLRTTYISGPGTGADGVVDAATGSSVRGRAETAYNRFVKQVQDWHRDNPNINVSVVSMGFSRGSTTALMASNLMYERGVPDPQKPGSFIIAPRASMPQAHILFDHVSTNMSTAPGYSTALPPTSMFAAQLRANDELRPDYTFHNVADHTRRNDPRMLTLNFPGAHADVGGGYRQDGIAQQTRLTAEILLGGLGLPVRESVPTQNPNAYVVHQSYRAELYERRGGRVDGERPGERVNFDASRYFGSPEPDPTLMRRFYGR